MCARDISRVSPVRQSFALPCQGPLSIVSVFDSMWSENSTSSSQFGSNNFGSGDLGSCLVFVFVGRMWFPAVCLLWSLRVAVQNDNANTVVQCRLLEVISQALEWAPLFSAGHLVSSDLPVVAHDVCRSKRKRRQSGRVRTP